MRSTLLAFEAAVIIAGVAACALLWRERVAIREDFRRADLASVRTDAALMAREAVTNLRANPRDGLSALGLLVAVAVHDTADAELRKIAGEVAR